jgi:hypothetical protein
MLRKLRRRFIIRYTDRRRDEQEADKNDITIRLVNTKPVLKRRCQQALSFTVYKHGKSKKNIFSENLWIVSKWITVEKKN